MMVFPRAVLKLVQYKQLLLPLKIISIPQVRCFHSGLRSRGLDEFISSIHKDRERRLRDSGTNLKHSGQKPISEDATKPVTGKAVKVNKEDPYVESLIQSSIKNSSLEDSMQILKTYSAVKRFPFRNTFKKLARISAENRSLLNLNIVKDILLEAYPLEYKWEMNFDHYKAEALWKLGDHKASIIMFEELFLKYPMCAKKLVDLVKFLTFDILEKNLEEEMDILVESMSRVSKTGIEHPLAKIWVNVFKNSQGRMNLKASKIVDECPEIQRYLLMETDNILLKARQEKNIDLLRRFIEVTLQLGATSENIEAVSTLLELQCEKGVVTGAVATFHYIESEKINVTAESLSRYTDLLKSENHSHSQNLKRLPTPGYKFKI